ncbi:MAG: ATP-dependent RecD-like DNA helicase, partial [Myxococcota bacterium]|nr:ATP-dependent RecD-like DNA helicase [Myxococcota bacterium]
IRGLGLGPTITHRLIERYGEDALAILRREPYRLSNEIQGIGFKTADRVALSNGLSPNSPERAQAGVSFTLSSAEAEGHCYLPRDELSKRAQKLGITSDCIEDAIEDMLSDRRLFEPTPSDQKIYRPQLGYIEKRIAKRLKRLCQSPPAKGSLFQQTIDVDSLQEDLKLTLNAEQKTAVNMALNNSVSIITGGPGTGKTTIIRALMTAASMRAENWQLAAPTGRAAKRMTEATGCEAKTIHRLLSYNGHSRKFSNNEESPLAAHAIIIDEASMLDLWLMDALLSAIQSGCRLILVGDIDQLPSVGPGRILSDLIYSEALPVVRLQDVYRQAQNSNIVRNAHRVNKGLPPISCEKDIDASSRKDFYVLYREEQPNAQDSIIEVVAKRLPKMGFHPLRDIQVLTPMHSGILGTTALNIRLQSELNPHGKSYKTKTKEFRVGDRVLQLKNDYENEIYNGDIGFVISIDEHGMIVQFDDRPILLSGSNITDLELAYAISIHKSQGSEYPAVVTLLHNAHRIMLRRNLLYTAMTRARSFCCIVGSSWAISFASKENTGGERWTSLQQYLEKMDEGSQ